MIHWRRNRPAVGYPPYVADAFSALFWLLPFQGEGYWGRFFTGRCPVLWAFAPLGRKKIRRNVRQSIPFVA
ncbi:MAG: hypothetical protein LBQ66_14615 [Planctomycetaceae bacterium]|nr:hypothetical protein [Planctomycetaceae bacterium]